MRKIVLTPAFLLLLVGCGARQAAPVAEVSVLDDRLSCAHLSGELEANKSRMAELGSEGERRARDNAGLLLMGPLSAVAFVDTGRTQQTETAALTRRNDRLGALLAQRGCPNG